MENNTTIDEEKETFFAKFNLDNQMAYYVAKVLHMRPLDILNNWTSPELIVAYGHYANQVTSENYENWKNLDTKTRSKHPKPSEYAVKFNEI